MTAEVAATLRALATAIEAQPPAAGPDPDQLLTVREAATLLAISQSQVRRLVSMRSLAAVRIGKTEMRVSRGALRAFVLSREQRRMLRPVQEACR